MRAAFPVSVGDLVERFPEWLEDAMGERGLKQYGLARAMSRDRYKSIDRSIYAYRSGACLPKLEQLSRLLGVLEPGGAYIVPARMLKELLEGAAWARGHGWRQA